MKMKTCIFICGIVLGVMIVYVRHRKQNKQSEQTEQGLLTERTDQASNSILDKIKELFKTDSKFHVPVNGPEFVEVLRLMDIVDYFKSLKLRKGHDIPFVANAKHPKIQEKLNDQSERPFALYLGTYNESTNNIENFRLIEINEIDDEIKNLLGIDPLVVLS